jgi:tetraacyldisaccharide 4'-kinase
MDGKKRSSLHLLRLKPPSWWYTGRIPPAAWGLLPVSAAYSAAVQRRFRRAKPYHSKLPVICVGNFTMGGAGKTPVALKLAALLQGHGIRPGFLTRGYGGRERGPHVAGASDDAARVGDEPLLLAGAAPTVVSRDRPAGARLLETLAADAIIMDDGFQNPSLIKDFSLIVIDAAAGLGSARVFPLGPLRAPLAFQAGMADAIVLLGGEGRGASIIEQINLSLRKKLPSSRLSSQGEKELLNGPRSWQGTAAGSLSPRGEGWGEGAFALGRNAFEARIVPQATEEMRARPFLAFCGIGRPAKFFDTLAAAGIIALKYRAFPDHHPYTEADARALLAEAKALNAGLITTAKDLARLKGASGTLAELRTSALELPIAIEFQDSGEAALLRAILAALSSYGVTGTP